MIGPALLCVPERRRWKSKFIESVLPRAEAALRKSRRVIRAIDAVEGIDHYRSVLDAALACIVPELRAAMSAHYDRAAPPLGVLLGVDGVAAVDARIAGFVEMVQGLGDEAVEAAIVEARKAAP